MLIQAGRPQTTLKLCQWSSASTKSGAFYTQTLVPMQEAGEITTAMSGGVDYWTITRKGLAVAEDLGIAHQKPDANVAQPRGIPYPSEPIQAGEYRSPRPGAYDFERCPSRMGDQLTYRDGRAAAIAA